MDLLGGPTVHLSGVAHDGKECPGTTDIDLGISKRLTQPIGERHATPIVLACRVEAVSLSDEGFDLATESDVSPTFGAVVKLTGTALTPEPPQHTEDRRDADATGDQQTVPDRSDHWKLVP